MDSYERVLLVKPEVFVYKIPPRSTNRGYRAADWNLQAPDWTGRMRLVNVDKDCIMKLEDKNSGELFAKCLIDQYPGLAVEAVLDSSRYFVIKIQDDNGRSAFIGIGFADRGDSFDLNVSLQDHFKWIQKSEEIAAEEAQPTESKPQLDLGFKEGQTIKIKMNIANKGQSRPKPRSNTGGSSGGSILLPPPPGGVKIPPPKSAVSQPAAASTGSLSAADDLLGLDSPKKSADSSSSQAWGDFSGASSNNQQTQSAENANAGGAWIQF